MVNTFLFGQERGCSKVIMGRGIGGIILFASWEKHFIRVCENLSQYPRILYPLHTVTKIFQAIDVKYRPLDI